MKLQILLLKILVDGVLAESEAHKVRGFLGSIFRHLPILHHHKPDGTLIYHYPVIQFKVIQGACIIIGFNEGTEVLKTIFDELRSLLIEGKWQEILSKSLYSYHAYLGITERPLLYTFLTPWLALNEENYQHYMCAGNWQARKQLLERILIGNILSLSKSLGYTVSEPIQLTVAEMRETKTKLKGTPMLGFLGNFRVNFEIPEYLGLGKSVSRGFGAVSRLLEY